MSRLPHLERLVSGGRDNASAAPCRTRKSLPAQAPRYGGRGAWVRQSDVSAPRSSQRAAPHPDLDAASRSLASRRPPLDPAPFRLTVRPADLSAYLTAAGVHESGTYTNVPVDGGGPVDTVGEATLDVETIVGIAPGANLIDYDVPGLDDQSVEDAYNKAVSDNLADAVNSSFGGCESADPTGDMAADAIAVQGAAKGITFIGTTGDTGSDECNTTPPNSPPGVSSNNGPHFLSVGSVDFTQDSTTGALTSVFYAFDPSNNFLSGGGVSTVYPLPSYQVGIPNIITSGRNQPDISLPGVDTAVYMGRLGVFN
jgi:hypothetical protein